MQFKRVFTKEGFEALHGIEFADRVSSVTSTNGSKKFEMKVKAPKHWSQVAVDILCQKYMRKAGVPLVEMEAVREDGVPRWLWRHVPSPRNNLCGSESDARQVFYRMADAWTYHAWHLGYFREGDNGRLSDAGSESSACSFRDEIVYMLAMQMAAPNSPQWFNTGLWWAYGITGEGNGLWKDGHGVGTAVEIEDSYRSPQVYACFIQNVEDKLLGEDGIMSLVEREARVFKFGGGSGSNFSKLRGFGEPLSGGGRSSGLMSFLGINDKGAGAIKSGGTTRRAAKMVILDADHPDIEEFVNWKVNEEHKVAALHLGTVKLKAAMNRIIRTETEKERSECVAAARRDGVPEVYVAKAIALWEQNLDEIDIPDMSLEFEGGAYATVNGQNANNSVRLTDEFMRRVTSKGKWDLVWRTEKAKAEAEGRTPKPCKQIDAAGLYDSIAWAAWHCADPGIQFDTTINEWNGCLKDGRIEGSNPCSEFLWLNNTGCNLASLNLLSFYSKTDRKFEFDKFEHAASIWTVILDVTVSMASYPSKSIAEGSMAYRTLGLGYANLGAMLMVMGHPYDSEEGRRVAACVTAIMHFQATYTSAMLAREHGRFPRCDDNREGMLRVANNHVAAVFGWPHHGDGVAPCYIHPRVVDDDFISRAKIIAGQAIQAQKLYGLRNAQVTLLAPTGTIGLVMDCDTTGVEPDFALVKFKKLAGGGYFKIINQSVPAALDAIGYTPEEIGEITRYATGHGTLTGCPHLSERVLGMTAPQVAELETHLKTAMDVRHLLPEWKSLGLSVAQWKEVNAYVCGTMTVEGAPYLDPGQYPVFACAVKCGADGVMSIAPEGHIDMMGAVQPFLSGAISKTVNVPTEATMADIRDLHTRAHERMVKAVAIYRDGSKLSQVLSGSSDVVSDLPPDAPPILRVAEKIVYRYLAKRRKLPDRRKGYTQKAKIGGHNVYLRTGEYDDGTLGEIFIDMHREGAAFRAFTNAFAIAVSLGLQHGVPLDEFVDAFAFMRFEPNGSVVGHDRVKNSTSIIDFIFRDLAITYLGRNDMAHVDPVEAKAEEPAWSGEKSGDSLTDLITSANSKGSKVAYSRLRGYTGDSCPKCGQYTMVRTGTCNRCDTCGESSGCV